LRRDLDGLAVSVAIGDAAPGDAAVGRQELHDRGALRGITLGTR
jgi:hypothetical protein